MEIKHLSIFYSDATCAHSNPGSSPIYEVYTTPTNANQTKAIPCAVSATPPAGLKFCTSFAVPFPPETSKTVTAAFVVASLGDNTDEIPCANQINHTGIPVRGIQLSHHSTRRGIDFDQVVASNVSDEPGASDARDSSPACSGLISDSGRGGHGGGVGG